MKNFRAIVCTVAVSLAQFLGTQEVFAQGVGSGPAPAPSRGLSYQLRNPLAFDSLQDFIVAILNVFIVIATPIVVIFIILAGFKYVTAQGNATKVQEATRALTYAIIGGVLIIGAVAVAEIIRDLVTSFS